MSKIPKRPNVSAADIDKFISGAPDATPVASTAAAPALPARLAEVQKAGGRKQPISLTIDSGILGELDKVAKGLGISRASAFSLAVSRFIAQEKKEA